MQYQNCTILVSRVAKRVCLGTWQIHLPRAIKLSPIILIKSLNIHITMLLVIVSCQAFTIINDINNHMLIIL